jgi:hypothetical protein
MGSQECQFIQCLDEGQSVTSYRNAYVTSLRNVMTCALCQVQQTDNALFIGLPAMTSPTCAAINPEQFLMSLITLELPCAAHPPHGNCQRCRFVIL